MVAGKAPGALLDENGGESQCQKMVRIGDLMGSLMKQVLALSAVVLANARTTCKGIVVIDQTTAFSRHGMPEFFI